jgi:bifunctional NMN adenylyltransferase/nudix hydrolase
MTYPAEYTEFERNLKLSKGASRDRARANSQDVGVIVGRFQVPELHDAHMELIQTVCDRHGKVIIFLGLSPLMVTRENPLDFEGRKQMILAKFPHVNVLYIKDQPDDEVWSRNLDTQIDDVITPNQTVLLYGGRDSFISHYSGKHPSEELESQVFVSGSEIRKEVSRTSVRGTPDFRAGVVWAAFSQFPQCFATVDVAILNEDGSKILLGRKANEKKFRLIGGFSDPKSPSYEADARREVSEEAGIEITDPVYVGSYLIDDWRYRKEPDRVIKTLLFEAKHMFGTPKPGDDIAEVKWFDLDWDLDVVPNHQDLINVIVTRRAHKQQV